MILADERVDIPECPTRWPFGELKNIWIKQEYRHLNTSRVSQKLLFSVDVVVF